MSDKFAKDFLTLADMVIEHGCDDRIAAIVCTAYIEDHIVAVISEFFPGMTSGLKKAFFDPTNGIARSLGNKLDMARALNAISDRAYTDGKLIGRIRNKFAHNLYVTSFDAPEVRDLVDQLQSGRDLKIETNDGALSDYDHGWDRSRRFRMVSLMICTALVHQHIKEYPFNYSSGSSSFGIGERSPSLDKLNKPPRRG